MTDREVARAARASGESCAESHVTTRRRYLGIDSRRYWTPAEDDVLISWRGRLPVLAFELGRSLPSVRHRRAWLRAHGTHIESLCPPPAAPKPERSERHPVESGAWDDVIREVADIYESARAIRASGGDCSRDRIRARRREIGMHERFRRWTADELASLGAWRGPVEEWATANRRTVDACCCALRGERVTK
jgi:hypothetical protein